MKLPRVSGWLLVFLYVVAKYVAMELPRGSGWLLVCCYVVCCCGGYGVCVLSIFTVEPCYDVAMGFWVVCCMWLLRRYKDSSCC